MIGGATGGGEAAHVHGSSLDQLSIWGQFYETVSAEFTDKTYFGQISAFNCDLIPMYGLKYLKIQNYCP
jgi:hypothetical protein